MAIITVPGPTITGGQSISNAVDLSAGRWLRINTDAGWSPPAVLSLQIAFAAGGPWTDLYDGQGREILFMRIAPDSTILIPETWPMPLAFVRFRSGSAAFPMPQQAGRVFACILET